VFQVNCLEIDEFLMCFKDNRKVGKDAIFIFNLKKEMPHLISGRAFPASFVSIKNSYK